MSGRRNNNKTDPNIDEGVEGFYKRKEKKSETFLVREPTGGQITERPRRVR